MPTSYRNVSAVIGGITYDATSLTVNNNVPNSTFNRLGERGIFRVDSPVEGTLSLSSFLTASNEYSNFIATKKETSNVGFGMAVAYLTSLTIEGDTASPVTLGLDFEGRGFGISTTVPSTSSIVPALGILTTPSGSFLTGNNNYTFSYSLSKNYGKLLYQGTTSYQYYLEGGEEKLTIEGEGSTSLAAPCPNTLDMGLNFSSCGGAIGGISIISGKVTEYSSQVQAGDIVKNTVSIVNTF
jgi:hypothetical protein